MTPAGIEPATFRFVAQHLNHCTSVVPHYITMHGAKKKTNKQTMVMNLWVPDEWNFWSGRTTNSFSIMNLFHEIRYLKYG